MGLFNHHEFAEKREKYYVAVQGRINSDVHFNV